MSFEESLIRNASPTLASIKPANLYSFSFSSRGECLNTIARFNSFMNPKGIYIELLKGSEAFYLIYVYRKSQLQRALMNPDIQKFLEGYSYYMKDDLQGHIDKLKSRLQGQKEFPHEIGVFLGYPLEDVKAFIATKGKHCVLCGDWKVYHDEETARCLFCSYRDCRELYIKEYLKGKSFSDMLVSA